MEGPLVRTRKKGDISHPCTHRKMTARPEIRHHRDRRQADVPMKIVPIVLQYLRLPFSELGAPLQAEICIFPQVPFPSRSIPAGRHEYSLLMIYLLHEKDRVAGATVDLEIAYLISKEVSLTSQIRGKKCEARPFFVAYLLARQYLADLKVHQ
jgi:hypothetical protein